MICVHVITGPGVDAGRLSKGSMSHKPNQAKNCSHDNDDWSWDVFKMQLSTTKCLERV